MVAGVAVVVLVVLLMWRATTPGQGPDGPSPAAGASPVPSEGRSRAPDARFDGRKVWLAPAPNDEADLPQVAGPLAPTVEVDVSYPDLRAGDAPTALMVMGVVDDTSTLTRLLVLDESWQVFELDLTDVRGPGGPTIGRTSLSPDGSRLAFGQTGAVVVLGLGDLVPTRTRVGETSTRELLWSRGSVVLSDGTRVDPDTGEVTRGRSREPRFGAGLGVVEGPVRQEPGTGRRAGVVMTDGIRGVATDSGTPWAVAVSGKDGGLLVLDGDRPGACCAVAAWTAPDHVLFEVRTGPRLDLLDWDTGSGKLSKVSTIEPVVSNEWYLVTSYAERSLQARS